MLTEQVSREEFDHAFKVDLFCTLEKDASQAEISEARETICHLLNPGESSGREEESCSNQDLELTVGLSQGDENDDDDYQDRDGSRDLYFKSMSRIYASLDDDNNLKSINTLYAEALKTAKVDPYI